MRLLMHVVEDDCTDPDCEVHQIEVGLEEGTVTSNDLAFFIAGAMKAEKDIREIFHGLEIDDPRERIVTACLYAGRRIVKLAEGR